MLGYGDHTKYAINGFGKNGIYFKNEDDLTIWVSDDKNHILVKVELGIWVGSIDATITSVENIKFPLSITE